MPRVQGHQNWYSQLSNIQIHKYTYTNTQKQLMTKCQEYQTYAIFLNSCWFKDVKNPIRHPIRHPIRSKSPLVDFRLLHRPPRFIFNYIAYFPLYWRYIWTRKCQRVPKNLRCFTKTNFSRKLLQGEASLKVNSIHCNFLFDTHIWWVTSQSCLTIY